ncbi:MAG: hypothetical protein H6Q79_2356 [Deltaproteobacteria bacterium]|nr:hypothetical protein [Deltaproteobacteria bacterium]
MKERFDARLRAIPAGALHGLLRDLSEIEAFRGWWDGARKPARPALLRIRESVISRSAASSTRGAGATPSPDSLGYAGALRAVFDGYAAMPPVEDRILALHAEVFRHLPGERFLAGRYKSATPRQGTERRFLSEPVALRSPGPLLIPAQMETLTRWLRSGLDGGEFHPLLVVGGGRNITSPSAEARRAATSRAPTSRPGCSPSSARWRSSNGRRGRPSRGCPTRGPCRRTSPP